MRLLQKAAYIRKKNTDFLSTMFMYLSLHEIHVKRVVFLYSNSYYLENIAP